MELSDLIKMLTLVPQFQGVMRDLRKLVTRATQTEGEIQSLDATMKALEATVNRLETTVSKLERELDTAVQRYAQTLRSNHG